MSAEAGRRRPLAEIAVVILAAGEGRRLGGVAKALLRDREEQSYLERITRSATAAGIGKLWVVVGAPHHEATAGEALRLGCEVAVNPRPERGMASSVAAGLAALQTDGALSGALIWPVDTPAVRVATLEQVLAHARPERAVVPTVMGRGGHPLWLGRTLWPEVEGIIESSDGLRALLARRRDAVVRVAVEDPMIRRDVDTAMDLAALRLADRAGAP